jgi:hypothetical protein
MLQICTGNKMSEIIILKICLELSFMVKLIHIKEIKGSERKWFICINLGLVGYYMKI